MAVILKTLFRIFCKLQKIEKTFFTCKRSDTRNQNVNKLVVKISFATVWNRQISFKTYDIKYRLERVSAEKNVTRTISVKFEYKKEGHFSL